MFASRLATNFTDWSHAGANRNQHPMTLPLATSRQAFANQTCQAKNIEYLHGL